MLSNPTRFGLIACRYLVWGWRNNVWITTSDIADRYSINVRALSPALQRLVRSGLLRSRRGRTSSGFMLSRSPEEITMLDVMRSLDGELHIDCCKTIFPGVRCTSDTSECRVCGLFRGLLEKLRAELASVTLADHAATEDFANITEKD